MTFDHIRGALIFVLVLMAPLSAFSVHTTGSRYVIVGFTKDAKVLVRLERVQLGPVQYEVLGLEKGVMSAVYPIEDPDYWREIEPNIRAQSGTYSIGFPGQVAPGRQAVVALVPGERGVDGEFSYRLMVADGDGLTERGQVAVPTRCGTPMEGPHAQLEIRWAPDGRTAVVAGAVVFEPACGAPTLQPVVLTVGTRGVTTPEVREALADLLEERVRTLAADRDHEALNVAVTLLNLMPGDASVLLEVARLRASVGDAGGAVSALWALRGLGDEATREALASAMAATWSGSLRGRAGFKALRWLHFAPERGGPATRPAETPAHRPPRGWDPAPGGGAEEFGDPWVAEPDALERDNDAAGPQVP